MEYMSNHSCIIPLDLADATALADFFTALSDPTRVRLISALAAPGAEFSVQALAEGLGMTHSAVSHQLRLLRRLRVVRARRDGRQRFYSLDDEHVAQLYHQGLDHIRHG
jgi:ArsR family transcriptional regulator, lead/cadmium/zinc/bismuth-responsive transcriptional repressor